MAHKKAGGSTRNGRDSHSKRLGIKCFGGQYVTAGSIIVKQNGTKFHAGKNTKCGRDYTLYALQNGIVCFKKNKKEQRTYINVIQ